MSFVGYEHDFIFRTFIKDPQTKKLMPTPLPKLNRKIYLWWTMRYHRCKDGSVSLYKYLHFSRGGVRETYYCDGKHYPDKFLDDHMYDFMYNYSMFIGNPEFHAPPLKKKKTKRRPGRPSALPPEVYELLDAAGFSTNGSSIVVKYKKFLTLEASAFRFSLLSSQDREAIGSADRLLDFSLKAYSLLKSCNRRSVQATFEDCFREVALKELGHARLGCH